MKPRSGNFVCQSNGRNSSTVVLATVMATLKAAIAFTSTVAKWRNRGCLYSAFGAFRIASGTIRQNGFVIWYQTTSEISTEFPSQTEWRYINSQIGLYLRSNAHALDKHRDMRSRHWNAWQFYGHRKACYKAGCTTWPSYCISIIIYRIHIKRASYIYTRMYMFVYVIYIYIYTVYWKRFVTSFCWAPDAEWSRWGTQSSVERHINWRD